MHDSEDILGFSTVVHAEFSRQINDHEKQTCKSSMNQWHKWFLQCLPTNPCNEKKLSTKKLAIPDGRMFGQLTDAFWLVGPFAGNRPGPEKYGATLPAKKWGQCSMWNTFVD